MVFSFFLVCYTATQLASARRQLTLLSAEPVSEAVLVAFNAEADAYNSRRPQGMTGARCTASHVNGVQVPGRPRRPADGPKPAPTAVVPEGAVVELSSEGSCSPQPRPPVFLLSLCLVCMLETNAGRRETHTARPVIEKKYTKSVHRRVVRDTREPRIRRQ